MLSANDGGKSHGGGAVEKKWRPRRNNKMPARPLKQKNAASPKGSGVFLIMTRKEELLCPWQAWQRPTLPGLKP
jgi:hypothetical protein